MNISIIVAASLWLTLSLAQVIPTQPDASAASLSPATLHDDPNWTLAFPTPKEITPPKTIPSPNCQAQHHSGYLNMSKIGATIIEFHVMPDGSIQDIKLDQSSNSDKVDEAVLSCIKDAWRYTPATYDGKPVEVTRKVRIDWHSK